MSLDTYICPYIYIYIYIYLCNCNLNQYIDCLYCDVKFLLDSFQLISPPLEESVYINYLAKFCMGFCLFSIVIYLFNHKFILFRCIDMYFILGIIIQYYFIYFVVQLFPVLPLGALLTWFCVLLTHSDHCLFFPLLLLLLFSQQQ